MSHQTVCPKCNGGGWIAHDLHCGLCDGTGQVDVEKLPDMDRKYDEWKDEQEQRGGA